MITERKDALYQLSGLAMQREAIMQVEEQNDALRDAEMGLWRRCVAIVEAWGITPGEWEAASARGKEWLAEEMERIGNGEVA